MLSHLILALEAIVAARVTSLQFAIDTIGHRLEILAKLIEGIEEIIAFQIGPGRLVSSAHL